MFSRFKPEDTIQPASIIISLSRFALALKQKYARQGAFVSAVNVQRVEMTCQFGD